MSIFLPRGLCWPLNGRLSPHWFGPAVLFGLSVFPSLVFAAERPQTQVTARYSIAFVGVDIGHFAYSSDVGPKNYTLSGDSRVKLLFGAFKWGSQSRTEGTLSAAPAPRLFDFRYSIRKKHKRSTIKFAAGRATDVVNDPPAHPSEKVVPLKPEHLIGVIDPMTAIMRMTMASDDDVCRQSAEIFDGRLRMRLTLSPKGRRSIKERGRSGQPEFGYVCQIKFVPIAGHKKSNEISHIADNKDMEIVLRPVPSAGILVPYQILIPTSFGTVTIAARSITVVRSGNPQIAMQF